ncbi:lacr bacterial regulatory protein hth signature [Lucifera butyrica]|uniref:Lacr bacterial regulatory protein hth signature n=1 Tax=Lucifera butyrica TaxID=1351585 RepID=A0A498RE30_9FIRM|nr:DeoR/GlpR family DNA-binding transcription regulator [Lucifera butyrica]VBB09187.1 lacr bacterial regulatory protein hth signature [Lucifera butyrica]
MLPVERHKRILEILSQKKRATTEELAKELKVSVVTIRSDFNKLEAEHYISKVHGGAVLASCNEILLQSQVDSTYNFHRRESLNSMQKNAICKEALQLIKDNQCILLDASSTCLTLARNLNSMHFRQLMVVTNGIYTMLTLKETPNITVVLIGGIVTKQSGSIEGLLGCELLNHIHADLAFVSAHGFTLNEGLTDFNLYEAELKKKMMEHAKKRIALLDYSKLENVSAASFCHTKDLDIVLTDQNAAPDIIDKYRKNGLNVKICD